jgi:two-component system, sensor histidine kinase and response regulator
MTSDLKDARILIVDDQPANVELLEGLLLMQGYTEIRSLTDSRKALDLIESFKPDLLLLDLMMPGVSGFDILEVVGKSTNRLACMPVLVLTADATPEAKQRSLKLGASDFLSKPFDLVEVGLRIRNLLLTVYLMQQLQNQNDQLEVKVQDRTQALRKQNQALKEIAWSQSHQVRAPLSRILGLISLLRDDSNHAPDDLGELLDFMQTSADELDEIVKEISQKAYEGNIFED